MIYEIKILESAKQLREDGLKWFESYQQNKNDCQYEMAMAKMARAEGLLEAFEIITGHEVRLYDIEKELSNY